MSFGEIRAIDRSCRSYRPGHQVHWIQAKKSVEDEQPVIDVSIVVHDDGRVDIEGDELELTLWNHDPDRLQSALDYCGRAVWKPRYHILSLPGLFGHVFNLASVGDRTPCKPGVHEAAPPAATENGLAGVLRAARDDHGFTAPLLSIWPRDVVEGQGKTSAGSTAPRKRIDGPVSPYPDRRAARR
jgi:hypothetical protein